MVKLALVLRGPEPIDNGGLFVMLQNNDQMLGMWRANAKSANAVANALLSGAERMLERQAEISREILAEYAEAAKQIESAGDVRALLSIQSRLARMQMEKAMSWWAESYAQAGASQKELLRTSHVFVLGLTETLSRTLDGMVPAPGTEPVMTAMKLVVDAARSSYTGAADPGVPAADATAPAAPEARPPTSRGRQAAG